jgi:diaminopropionate ammonia-lyase
VAVEGMRRLATPVAGDPPVVAGESGAVTAGLLAELCGNPSLKETARQMGLDAGSKILLLSTEGDTDPRLYRRLVTG